MVSPGTAKNALCVGAVANVFVRPDASKQYFCGVSDAPRPRNSNNPFAATSDEGMHTSSVGSTVYEDESIRMSRLLSYISGSGVSYDGRFKPEVLAPGHFIVSALARALQSLLSL